MKNFENFFSFGKRSRESVLQHSFFAAVAAAFVLSFSLFSVNIYAQGSADLSVSDSAAPNPVPSGTNATFQIVLTNNSSNSAANTVLVTTVPANTTFVSFAPVTEVGFTCTTPAVGGTGNITCTNASPFLNGAALFKFVVNVNPGTPNGTVITNSVSVSSSTPDPNAANNSATATTIVSGASTPTPTPTPTITPTPTPTITPTPTPTPTGGDLSVTNVDSPDPVTAGNNITYSIILTNNGPSSAAGVNLTTTVPAGTTFVSISPSSELGFNCTTPAQGGTGNVSCMVPVFNNGAILFKFIVTVNGSTPNGTIIMNSVSVSSTTPDPNPLNNTATATTLVNGTPSICLNKTLDYNGDRRADYAVFRPSNNFTYVNPSSEASNLAFTGRPFGDAATDTLTPGDYDGDGKTDIAVWRSTNGTFYVIRSSDNTVTAMQYGLPGDEPVARDYDGDCKTDFAVVRRVGDAKIWFIFGSATNTSRGEQFGLSSDIVAPGDYDGDGKYDLAVFRGTGDNPATFFVKQSSNNAVTGRQFGLASDLVVPGDYDGDGKTDFAVARPGTSIQWFILRSSDNTVTGAALGAMPDLPTQADYDGDGKTDISVYRQQIGTFFVRRSLDGVTTQRQFGSNGDYPVANYDTH